MKNNMKSVIVMACALLLVVGAVFGTFAYLSDTSDTVTNTFVVGKLFDPEEPSDEEGEDDFVLYEHAVTDANSDGVYELSSDVNTGNKYSVLPGVALPKDPFVKTNKTLCADAYVFVEVVDSTASQLHAEVDSTVWTPVAGAAAKHSGATVYTLKTGPVKSGSKLATTSILSGNKVTVDDFEESELTAPGELTFYGYLMQASGFDTAAKAWEAYNASTSSTSSAN